MKKIIILLLACLIMNPVLAADWYEVTNNQYIDRNSIHYYSYNSYQNIAIAWSKILVKKKLEMFNNQYVWYMMAKDEYNCSSKYYKRSRPLSIVFYGLEGKILSHSDYSSEQWSNVVPDSQGETVWNYICGYN